MGDETTPLRNSLNNSGIPFQLAVENVITTVSAGIQFVKREVPGAGDFIDVVARSYNALFVFECKRVDDKAWVFVMSDVRRGSSTRCRLEWFNSKAPVPRSPLPGFTRVFCDEWFMAEGSPESDFCIMPKQGATSLLEETCRKLLAGGRQLLADETVMHEVGYLPLVPVVVTTAKLYVCQFDPTIVSLDTGKLDTSGGQFVQTNLVRFRKTFVTTKNNSYESSQMILENWVSDRERTVFVLNPSALERFLTGFRSFGPSGPTGVPNAFFNPPTLD
jgi:hypothetical protein